MTKLSFLTVIPSNSGDHHHNIHVLDGSSVERGIEHVPTIACPHTGSKMSPRVRERKSQPKPASLWSNYHQQGHMPVHTSLTCQGQAGRLNVRVFHERSGCQTSSFSQYPIPPHLGPCTDRVSTFPLTGGVLGRAPLGQHTPS